MPDATLSEIERQVAQDRAAFETSLERLGQTLAPDRLRRELSDAADRYGSELGGQAWSAARDNPAAFALVGAGLALLLSGAGQRHDRPADVATSPRAAGNKTNTAQANMYMRTDAPKPVTGPSAKRLRAALNHGLEALPPKARVRVLRARQAALEAQRNLEQRAARARRKTDRTVQNRPVATGAAAFGMGAVIAALLPSTDQEDAALGQQRDALMARARQSLEDEMAQLKNAASSALQSAQQSPSMPHVPSE